MSSIVIAGDTSGSVTIAAPAIAGTTVITLPATTGTLLASGGALGTPSSGTLTSCTGLPMTTGVTGTLPVANGGTGVTSSTGSGANVLGTSPTITGATITVASTAAPAFSAYQSTLNAVALNVYTKLSFQTELFDTNNNFDSTTNYRFTPTVTGYYQFSGSVFMSTGSGTRVGLLIYKNGVINCSSYGTGGSITGGQSQQITALLYANGTTDYFELYVLQDGIASVNTAASLNLTYFQGFLARSA